MNSHRRPSRRPPSLPALRWVTWSLILLFLVFQSRNLSETVENLEALFHTWEQDSLTATELLKAQVDEYEQAIRQLNQHVDQLEVRNATLTGELESSWRRIEAIQKWMLKVEVLDPTSARGVIDSLVSTLQRAGIIRVGKDVTELFKSTLIGYAIVTPSQMQGVEGRIYPIAIYREGECFPPRMDPQTAKEDWSLVFDIFGDFTLPQMEMLTVSSVITCGTGEQHSVAGLVRPASNPGLVEGYESLRSNRRAGNSSESKWEEHSAEFLVISKPPDAFMPRDSDVEQPVFLKGYRKDDTLFSQDTPAGSEIPSGHNSWRDSNWDQAHELPFSIRVSSESDQCHFEFLQDGRMFYSYDINLCIGEEK